MTPRPARPNTSAGATGRCDGGRTQRVAFASVPASTVAPASCRRPEPTHALAECVREALRCKETGEEKVILTALCGHAHLDLPAYANYLAGNMCSARGGTELLQAYRPSMKDAMFPSTSSWCQDAMMPKSSM
jgi:hypothetical protein